MVKDPQRILAYFGCCNSCNNCFFIIIAYKDELFSKGKEDNSSTDNTRATTATTTSFSKPTTTPKPIVTSTPKSTPIVTVTPTSRKTINFSDAESLYNNGTYAYITPDDLHVFFRNLIGEKVFTVCEVSEVNSTEIKCTIGDTFMMTTFNVTKDYSGLLKRDDIVAILSEP